MKPAVELEIDCCRSTGYFLAVGQAGVNLPPQAGSDGLDLLAFPTIIFGETGYSIAAPSKPPALAHRAKRPVRVKSLHYAGTMQESYLRLVGKKLLVAVAVEGKFATVGHQAFEDNGGMLTAMGLNR